MGHPVNIELFKTASTLFLGIGVVAVLQTELLPTGLTEVSRRGRGRFSSVDAFLTTVMFLLIAAGEFMCIRVLASTVNQARLAHESRPWVIALLVVTAAYVLGQWIATRALARAWRRESEGGPAKCAYDELWKVLGWTAMGSGIGLVVLSRLVSRTPDVFLVSPHSPLEEAWIAGLVLVILGLVMRFGVSRLVRPAESQAASALGAGVQQLDH